jgi:hypothetical protein
MTRTALTMTRPSVGVLLQYEGDALLEQVPHPETGEALDAVR